MGKEMARGRDERGNEGFGLGRYPALGGTWRYEIKSLFPPACDVKCSVFLMSAIRIFAKVGLNLVLLLQQLLCRYN
jgi:hypothetical protein